MFRVRISKKLVGNNVKFLLFIFPIVYKPFYMHKLTRRDSVDCLSEMVLCIRNRLISTCCFLQVSIGCPEKMEPITKVSHIPASRWALSCSLCREHTGTCIQVRQINAYHCIRCDLCYERTSVS